MINSQFKFSLVIPSFNDLRIIETIQSVNNQSISRKDIEIVIMDGGSDAEVIAKIHENLQETDQLISEQDDGIFDGINKGINKARGEVIFTLGSDDRLAYKDAVKDILSFFTNENLDYLCSSLIYTSDDWSPVRFWEATRPGFWSFLIGRQVGHFSFAAKKKVYDQLGLFNKELFVSADFDFFLRLGKSSMQGGIFKKVVTHMKLGGNSSKNIKNILRGNFQMLKVAATHYGPLCVLHFALKPFWKIREYKKAKNALQ